jgi:hypothetical protein
MTALEALALARAEGVSRSVVATSTFYFHKPAAVF